MPSSYRLLHPSPQALDALKGFETGQDERGRLLPSREPALKAYRDPVGIWTIGWGATGKNIRAGVEWTALQCEMRFVADVTAVASDVSLLVSPSKFPTTQNQFDALILLAYNIGPDMNHDGIAQGLGDSTLLAKHNAGNFDGAAAEFAKWCHAKGQVLAGLVRRRAFEAQIYRKGW